MNEKKIEPTQAMVDIVDLADKLMVVDTRDLLRYALNHPDAPGLFTDAVDHPEHEGAPTMSTPTEPRVQTIENAALDDVRPGDHLTWDLTWTHREVTLTNRREGIACHRDEFGDWWAKDGGCITVDGQAGATLTIRRAVQELPTTPGTVIAPADGHEYITATVGGATYHARESILIGKDDWHAAWRSDEGVQVYVAPEQITPGTWKVGNR